MLLCAGIFLFQLYMNTEWQPVCQLFRYQIQFLGSEELPGAPNVNFRKISVNSEDDLRSRVFGTFVVKFLVFLPVLGFSNI